MADYVFYGFFTASKAGKTGLTPTCTVYRAATGAVVANAQAATEIGLGLYRYTHTDAVEGDYVAVFVTADATVDAQNVPALASVAVPRIDAAVTTRSTLTAQQVWEYATRTLSSFGTLAADVWAAATRTLTSSAAQTAATVEGDNITVTRGDTWSVTLTGLGNISAYVSLDFTVKTNSGKADTAATVRIRKNASGVSDGLLILNGAAGTAAQGTITIDDAVAGDITITLAATAAAQIEPRTKYYYDIQMITANTVQTLTSGELTVVADFTRAVS